MKRRSFLRMIGVAAVAPFVPMAVAVPPVNPIPSGFMPMTNHRIMNDALIKVIEQPNRKAIKCQRHIVENMRITLDDITRTAILGEL